MLLPGPSSPWTARWTPGGCLRGEGSGEVGSLRWCEQWCARASNLTHHENHKRRARWPVSARGPASLTDGPLLQMSLYAPPLRSNVPAAQPALNDDLLEYHFGCVPLIRGESLCQSKVLSELRGEAAGGKGGGSQWVSQSVRQGTQVPPSQTKHPHHLIHRCPNRNKRPILLDTAVRFNS